MVTSWSRRRRCAGTCVRVRALFQTGLPDFRRAGFLRVVPAHLRRCDDARRRVENQGW